MDVALIIVEALKFIFPAYCANGTPVLAGGWGVGIGVGLIEGMVFGFNNFPVLFALLIPLGALLGDLTGAFIKRRLSIAPGGLLPVVDQIDFVVGAVVFSLPLMLIGWEVLVTVLLITPPIHLFTNFLAYKMKLKKHPW